MVAWFRDIDPIYQALLAGGFTWLLTAMGASLVFTMKQMPRSVLNALQGFAAGVMIAASIWSLLLPAISLVEEAGGIPWIPATIGFVAGAGGLRLFDAIIPHLHLNVPRYKAEGLSTTWRRTTLLVLAITLHNIPEGLAVGVAFGAASERAPDAASAATLAGAVTLAIGIGLQNLPEGIAVAMPLRGEGVSRLKSFWYGQLSAAVEPLAAVTGVAAVLVIRPILPYALAFAAGAMIFVVVEELIPESQHKGNTDLATFGTIVGFAVMMTLDVALG